METKQEKLRRYGREWYHRNRDRMRERAREYRRKNPNVTKINYQRYRQKIDAGRGCISVWARLKIGYLRSRCSKHNIPFNLSESDLINAFPVDGKCPITGEALVTLNKGKKSKRSASIDRIKPHLGYVKGNIAIISFQANAMKQDCTDPELFIRLANWMKEKM